MLHTFCHINACQHGLPLILFPRATFKETQTCCSDAQLHTSMHLVHGCGFALGLHTLTWSSTHVHSAPNSVHNVQLELQEEWTLIGTSRYALVDNSAAGHSL